MPARFPRFTLHAAALLLVSGADCLGQGACLDDEVEAHVRGQMAIYGPKSLDREYFAFIYRDAAGVNSSVMRGNKCARPTSCAINTEEAAKGIPKGAKVLGEWHSHPTGNGSKTLSQEDVWGAWRNRKIRCYTAYYGASDGAIFSWSPAATSIWDAMQSRVPLGNYREPPNEPAIIAAHQDPGSTCLSTNTNALTADTRTRYCKRSATSR